MNISCFGARFYGGQIDRIENEFKILGHDINSSDFQNIIYSNDMAHADDAIFAFSNQIGNCRLLLNVLDCPSWVNEWPKIREEWSVKLKKADKVTCISKAVQNDIQKYFNIYAEVIYNPVKPVYYMPDAKQDILALFVGRAMAPNKRVREIIFPLYKMLVPFFGENCIHFVGSENTGFGINHGVVSDSELNELYNRSVFTLISSSNEGLNLPLIESIIAGSIPIVCHDMSTALEFAPKFTLCEPSPIGMYNKMFECAQLIKTNFVHDSELNLYAQKYASQFSSKSVASNILKVYDSIK